MMQFFRKNNKVLYVAILSLMALCLLAGYVPGLSSVSKWVTPPVAVSFGSNRRGGPRPGRLQIVYKIGY